jgi:hypothetical protein
MKSGARSWSLATLSPSMIVRISVDFGVGVVLAVVAVGLNAGGWLNAILDLIVAIVGGFVAYFIMKKFLQWLVATAGAPSRRRALWRTLKRHPLIWLLVFSFAIGALPTVLLVVISIWVFLLEERRGSASEHRWTRYAPDVVFAALTGLGWLLYLDRDLLATQPAAGLFFAVGAWFSIRAWRLMIGSQRWAVRAGADIALSLLLGADLVLLVVWGANLLALPHAEIAIVRSTLERVGSIADLPWPLWVGLYVLLAGLNLASALRPDRLTAIVRWSQRFRIAPSIDVRTRKHLTKPRLRKSWSTPVADRPLGELGMPGSGPDGHHRQTQRRHHGICRAAPPMGRGTNVWLAVALPPADSRL